MESLSATDKVRRIKTIAEALGFEECGITKATKLEADAERLKQWLEEGHHAGMKYMENHFDMRSDPELLVPGAKSIITLLKNYYPLEKADPWQPIVAKYAYGKDYHNVIRKQLKKMLRILAEQMGPVKGRGFVDSAPVMERSWAVRSGLGWIGKNGCLIHPGKGSFFFIATLITDLELTETSREVPSHCGNCTRCIDACPTKAISLQGSIDAGRCIAYLTIENRENKISDNFKGLLHNRLFGCDICQDVCPWNKKFASAHHEDAFKPINGLLSMRWEDWEAMDEIKFEKQFESSALKRSGLSGIKRNLAFLKTSVDMNKTEYGRPYYTAYIMLGGNRQNRRFFLEEACRRLSKNTGKILKSSAFYRTAPWGKEDQEDFLNQCIKIRTRVRPEGLMRILLNIEKDLGRIRTVHYGARTLDLDLLMINDIILKSSNLTLPHPAIELRRFVLLPLLEIAPESSHPISRIRFKDLLIHCKDKLPVKKLGISVTPILNRNAKGLLYNNHPNFR